MENKLTFCDYINHPSFIQLKDAGDFFEVKMKSIVCYTGTEKPFFKSIDDKIVPEYKYIILFSKKLL